MCGLRSGEQAKAAAREPAVAGGRRLATPRGRRSGQSFAGAGGVRCALLEAAGEEGTPRDCQGRTLRSLWLVLSETQAQKSGDLPMAVES